MCIVYFASHCSCTHSHLLGAWNCGLNCPTDTRHIFYLDEGGYGCSTCHFLHGEELDPDILSVQYYPPLFDPEKEKREIEEAMYAEDGKALSDADSETSHWRAENTEDQGREAYETPKRGRHMVASEDTTLQQMTPRAAAHKSLVRDQLKKLPRQGMQVHCQPMEHFSVFEPMAQTLGDPKFWIPPVQGGVVRKA